MAVMIIISRIKLYPISNFECIHKHITKSTQTVWQVCNPSSQARHAIPIFGRVIYNGIFDSGNMVQFIVVIIKGKFLNY